MPSNWVPLLPPFCGRQMWTAPQHALCAHRQGLGRLQRVRQPGRDPGVNIRDLHHKLTIIGKVCYVLRWLLTVGSCGFGLLLPVCKMRNCGIWPVPGSAVNIGEICGNMVALTCLNVRAASFIILILSHTRSHIQELLWTKLNITKAMFKRALHFYFIYPQNVKMSQNKQIIMIK